MPLIRIHCAYNVFFERVSKCQLEGGITLLLVLSN